MHEYICLCKNVSHIPVFTCATWELSELARKYISTDYTVPPVSQMKTKKKDNSGLLELCIGYKTFLKIKIVFYCNGFFSDRCTTIYDSVINIYIYYDI